MAYPGPCGQIGLFAGQMNLALRCISKQTAEQASCGRSPSLQQQMHALHFGGRCKARQGEAWSAGVRLLPWDSVTCDLLVATLLYQVPSFVVQNSSRIVSFKHLGGHGLNRARDSLSSPNSARQIVIAQNMFGRCVLRTSYRSIASHCLSGNCC